VLEEGPILADICAVNSIYLNAAWANAFIPENTNQDYFYINPTRDIAQTEKAHFMHMVTNLGYTADAIPGVQLIQLPYRSREGGLYMTIILPVMEYAGKVSSLDVVTAHHNLTSRAVALALPKFQFQSSYKPVPLQTALEACGLTAPFSLDPGKGFCGMLTNACLLMSEILQKTSINVDEQGTEAASASVAIMDRGEPTLDNPILFMADHPFQFFICDSDEDLCFFEGRVGAPSIPPGSLAPLAALHAEEDFWLTHFGFNVSVEEGIGITNATGTNSTAPNTSETNTTTSNSPINTGSLAAVSISFVALIALAALATSAWS
jgi:serpin B